MSGFKVGTHPKGEDNGSRSWNNNSAPDGWGMMAE